MAAEEQNGQSIMVNQKSVAVEKLTIIEYLSKQFDLPFEFFETLHLFFQKDIPHFSKVALKFFRRLEQKKHQRQLKASVPFQSLVTLQENTIQNILAL